MTSELLRIRTYGDPILRQIAAPVHDFDDALRTLLDGMHATMDAAGGKGIAGNQVGVLLRVFAWRSDAVLAGSCVNPEVVYASEATESAEEGCLSFPRLFRFSCDRPTVADVQFQDEYGEHRAKTVTGRMARTFLHEIDHLNGILFIDHLAAHDRRAAAALIAGGALENIPQPYADELGA